MKSNNIKPDEKRLHEYYNNYKYDSYLYILIGYYAVIGYSKRTEDDEVHARQAIKEFYNVLKRMKPEEEYRLGREIHNMYLTFIFNLDNALKQEKYCDACNALYDCIEYGILQKRCYYNVLEIIENRMEFLGDEK